MLQLLVAIVITNFDESHKITCKRRLIDAVESKIELGKSVNEAMQLVLGHVIHLGEGQEVNVKLGKKSLTMLAKKPTEDEQGLRRMNANINQSNRALKYLVGEKMKTSRKESEPITPLQLLSSSTVNKRPARNARATFDNLKDMKAKLNAKDMTPAEADRNYSYQLSQSCDHMESIDGDLSLKNRLSSVPQDMADDMSIHLNYDLISDKLDVILPSVRTAGVTKATTRNIREVILENESKEETEERKERVTKTTKVIPLPKLVNEDAEILSEELKSPIGESSFIFSETEESKDSKKRLLSKIWHYMTNASCFIFYKNWRLRETILPIVTTPEDIVVKTKAELNPERYGIADLSRRQSLNRLDITDGKLLTSKEAKRYSRIFEYFIVIIILLSCIMLCIDTPLNNPDTAFSNTMAVFDTIFSFIFLIEAILKIIAFGFFWNNYQGVNAYILNGWNMLDFSVVVISFVDIYFSYIAGGSGSSQNLSSFKSLRAIRALRPLRMISRNEGLKVAIQALIASVPAMGNVLIICLLFLLIFAILGVNFFKGAFYNCVHVDTEKLSQVRTKND